jgi:hypothetical protein
MRETFGRVISRREWLGALAATASLGLIGCGSLGSHYRQRITVEVETPEGLKSGSSVSEVRWGGSGAFGELGGSRASARGEAVFVDLPDGQTLFALTAAADHADWLALAAAHAVGDQIPAENRGKADYFEKHKPSGILGPEHYPILVRFRNIRDPATIEFVRPENFEAIFGFGVRLIRITLQISDEDITEKIEHKLPWLTNLRGSYIDGSSMGSENNRGVHRGYFSTKFYK